MTYFSVKVRLRSQVMMGRLRRSLYVGRITEYLSLVAVAFVGAIVIATLIIRDILRKVKIRRMEL